MSEDRTEPLDPHGQLSQLVAAVRGLQAEIKELKEKVETRLYDTRPIWEQALAELSELRGGQGQIRAQVDGLPTQIDGLRTQVEELRTQVEELRTQVGELRDDFNHFRAETSRNLRQINRQLEVLGYEFAVKLRAENRELEDRVIALEQKLESPSA